MSLLWLEVQKDFDQFSYYLQDADGVRQRQRGVFRTNCIDCLDRTNVVQGLLARHHLEAVLHRLRILPAGQNLPSYFPGVRAPSSIRSFIVLLSSIHARTDIWNSPFVKLDNLKLKTRFLL